MIDLSFLTEAEQEAILQVLQRDAELKKAEEDRIRNLQKVIDDENELKYRSGQWFYEAKSKRHRDKIHGADLVRASIRKRKKPATIAELGKSSKDKDKKNWVNSVNKDIFIPPELYGVMEDPEDELEDLRPTKVETNQSTKKVSFLPTDKENNPFKNGTASPIKQRKNPFNSANLSEADFENDKQRPNLENGTGPIREQQRTDNLSSKVKFGVKLPYPELNEDSQTLRAAVGSPKSVGQAPLPKPRKLLNAQNAQTLDSPNVSLKREDSVNGTGKPRGILKRCSSSSSTDSDNLRLSYNNDASRLALPSSPIPEVGRESPVTAPDLAPENTADKLKQVRFSTNVLQKPPSPGLEPSSGREIGEFRILDLNLLQAEGDHTVPNQNISSINTLNVQHSFPGLDNGASVSVSTQNNTLEAMDTRSPPTASLSSDLDEILEDSTSSTGGENQSNILEETAPEINLVLQTNNSTDPEPIYAQVKKTPKTPSSDTSADKKPVTESPDVSKPNSVDTKQGSEDSNPILTALRRSEAKALSKPLVEVAPASPNQSQTDIPKEDLELGNPEVPTETSFSESQFSNPEKLKRLSQSVPAFLHDETDDRETDSASESSFRIGRHKKSPSSLTNLSGSSGMASLSSVSGSVMSIYSGDFGSIDVKGNIQFAVDYVEQLKEFHVFVSQCKDLAIADVKKQRSDPYVKSYLLPDKAKMGKRKTAVKKKTLNPAYNEILRYKIEKNVLLNQRLNLSVWHNDALGRNSFLGEVDIDLATWDWTNKQMNWYPLQPRTPAAGIGLENRGEMKLALKYVPASVLPGARTSVSGEVHIWIKDCSQLPLLRGNKINSFVKCTILPDTSRKSRQKTRTVDKTPNPHFNHTMVYDGFKEEDLREACVELTVWDHNRLTNHFLGGLRIGLGTGKSYGTVVDWMDSSIEESTVWEKMMSSPDTWIEAVLPLRMLKVAKLVK